MVRVRVVNEPAHGECGELLIVMVRALLVRVRM